MKESSGANTVMSLTTLNYSIWKSRIEDMLWCYDLEDTILGDSAEPSNMIDEKWKKLNRKVISIIKQWVENVFNDVCLWD